MNPTDDVPRPRKLWRKMLLPAGLILLATAGFVVSRSPVVRNWFEAESFDAAAAAELRKAAAAPPAAAGADWPQWRGPSRDGRGSGPLRTDWAANPPKVLWTAPCGGGYSSFAVAGGKVYTQDKSGDTERLLAFDAVTGKPAGEFAYPVDYSGLKLGFAGGPRATPAVFDGRIYFVGATGQFHAIAAGTMTKLWSHDLAEEFRAALPNWGVACSPLVEGELVIVQPGGRVGSIVAFDRITGERRWAAAGNPSGYSSPVAATVGGERQIIAVTGDAAFGLNPLTGEVRWTHPWVTQHNGNVATPVVVGDAVFLSSAYNKGCCLLRVKPGGDGVSVVYNFKNRVMRNHHSSSVFRDGHLYGYDDNELKCIDFFTGEEKPDWVAADATGKRPAKGSVILVGDSLIGLTQTGTLFLADAAPGEYRPRGQVENALTGSQCWAAPAYADGRIYLRDDAKVACYDVR